MFDCSGHFRNRTAGGSHGMLSNPGVSPGGGSKSLKGPRSKSSSCGAPKAAELWMKMMKLDLTILEKVMFTKNILFNGFV